MHPYWDVARYVKNFEVGLTMAWERFLRGEPPEHLWIEETEAAKRGTYDEELRAHPSDGPLAAVEEEVAVESAQAESPPVQEQAAEANQQQASGNDEL